jgi:hypothetical protein
VDAACFWQVEEWSEDLVVVEANEKESAALLLFVIDKQTRALASVVEASEYICRGRNVVLSIEDVAPDTEIGGSLIGTTEMKDLNRMRSYLRDVATRHAVPYTTSVEEAVRVCLQKMETDQKRRHKVD